MSENPIQEFSFPYNQLVRLEFAETKCAKWIQNGNTGKYITITNITMKPKNFSQRKLFICIKCYKASKMKIFVKEAQHFLWSYAKALE